MLTIHMLILLINTAVLEVSVYVVEVVPGLLKPPDDDGYGWVKNMTTLFHNIDPILDSKPVFILFCCG